jgi:SAM-dependent methyltransferase
MGNFWENFYKERTKNLIYPDENLVRLVSWLSLNKQAMVIDIGCGGGRHIAFLKEQGFLAYGVDKFAKPLPAVKDHIVIGDVFSLPFKNSTFDVVILWGVLHYLKTVDEAIKEICRILVPDGYMIFSVRNKEDTHLATILKETEYRLFSDNDIDELMHRYGFNIIARQYVKRSLINNKDTIISHTNIIAKRI